MAKRKNKVTIKSGGVGSTIAKVAKATKVDKLVQIFLKGEDCNCKEREEIINKLLPYRFKAKCLNEEQYNDWTKFRNNRTLKLEWTEVLYVCKTYSDIFSRLYWQPECFNCQGTVKTMIEMIKKIDLVWEQYETK